MNEPAILSPRCDAASSECRVRHPAIVLLFTVAAFLMIVGAAVTDLASIRTGGTSASAAGSGVALMGATVARAAFASAAHASAERPSIAAAEVEPAAEFGSFEFGVTQASQHAAASRWAPAFYPPAPADGASRLAPGSPHRPPQAA